VSRRLVALTLAVVGAAALATAVPAVAATGTDLYVDQYNRDCIDTGAVAGTQDRPFCTLQPAADAASPGQTVHVGNGDYASVTVTRSGASGAPITFVGTTQLNGFPAHTTIGVDATTNIPGAHAFTLTGVHDVVISTFGLEGTDGAVVVDDSSHVTIDGNSIIGTTVQSTTYGVSLTGATSAITVSRNQIRQFGTAGVSVGAGISAMITTNVIANNFGPAVVATDAPGTVVTSNSVGDNCVSGIVLGGASPGSLVENNLLFQDDRDVTGRPNCTPHANSPTAGEIVVAAAATEHTVVDYNLIYTTEFNALYSWAGVAYKTLASFQAAAGQGAHDINADPKFAQSANFVLAEGSPAIDSADPTAQGEQPTDINGAARADDPLVANTGLGFADRGASEFQDPFKVTFLAATPDQGPLPLPVTLTPNVSNPWSTAATYAYDFGDGTTSPASSSPTAQHTYTASPTNQNNAYYSRMTATLPSGRTIVQDASVTITQPGPVSAKLQATQVDPLSVQADGRTSTDPWRITEYDLDFGDGSPVVVGEVENHTYAAPGTYTITLTIKDNGGHTASTSKKVTVAGAYYAAGPVRLLDTRTAGGPLGAGGTRTVQVAGQHGLPSTGISAVVVNLTATDATEGSFLSVYPSDVARPSTSNLNFDEGQTVANLVTVPVSKDGKITIANDAGSADVVVDLQGFYSVAPLTPALQGHFLETVAPHRVLDTRDGTGGVPVHKVGANRSLTLTLPDADWHGEVREILLNVTVTDATADSVLSVYSGDTTTPPTASNLNFRAGQNVANMVIVPVGAGGKITFHNDAGSVDVIADVQGHFVLGDPWTAASSFTPVAPTRVLDTRDGTGGRTTPIGEDEAMPFTVAGVGPVPADATAVVLNVTAVGPSVGGFLSVYPDGGARPDTSNINYDQGQVTQGQVVVPVGPGGRIDFYNAVGTVDVVADVFGFFA
jgi:PKD repeat protein